MDQFKKSDLQGLLVYQDLLCLSLLMPTERAGTESQQNPIRFKNLLNQAESRLVEVGLRTPEIQKFLEPAQEQLLNDSLFWQRQSNGLAVFLGPDLFRYYRLPLAFEEKVIVGPRFYIKPTLALFKNAGHFYILALSQNELRFLEGTRYRVDVVDLASLPASLAEVLKWDDPERQLQQHSVSGGRQGLERGREPMAFHGHGVGKDDEKTNVLRYFHRVDRAVSDFLAEERVPLLLAGVEYLFPLYREANSYPHLLEQGIPGNPEELSEKTLHTRAWDVVRPLFQKEEEEAIARYRQETGRQSGRASADIKEIVPAAYSGRVEQLLVQNTADIWGKYDLANNRVEVHQERTTQSEDLLNTAALYTFQNDGSIYVVEDNEMPDSSEDVSPVAAVFRY